MTEDASSPQGRPADQTASTARTRLVARRRALLAVEPEGVRDLDRAAACDCACHPQPGRDLHGTGLCPCQLTRAEREAATDQLNRALCVAGDALDPFEATRARRLAAAAAALHIEAHEDIPMFPWLISGTVDGHRFVLRERGDTYTLDMAVDGNTTLGTSDQQSAAVTIRSGTVDDLSGPDGPDATVAAHLIAASIRTHVRQATCPHPHAPADRYCPVCGAPLTDPAQP